jgi:hypothetical protein
MVDWRRYIIVTCEALVENQGDQVGQIFDQWAMVYFGQIY